MRIDFIDGLRGVFALLVVYIHYSAFFYATLPDGFYNSCAMVCGFFILSGFVLSYKFFQNPDTKILTSAALRRYIRLTFPPFISIFFAYFLMKYNLIFLHEVCAITDNSAFMESFYNFSPHLSAALMESFFGIYFAYDQIQSYNPVLWTMAWELKGSFLCFAFLALFGKIKNRVWLYLIFIALTFKTLYLAFVIGIIFADAKFKSNKILSWTLLFAGIFLSYYALNFLPIYDKMNLQIFSAWQMNTEEFFHVIGATMIIFAVIQSDNLKKFFAWKYFVLIGKYSFSLYLIHAQIMISIGGIIFLKFGMAAAISCGLLATIPTAFLLHNFVDLPSGKLARRFEKFFK